MKPVSDRISRFRFKAVVQQMDYNCVGDGNARTVRRRKAWRRAIGVAALLAIVAFLLWQGCFASSARKGFCDEKSL